MSFFGFDATLPERRGGLPNPASGGGGLGGYDDDQAGAEDVAVYTWGNEDYDGLGDRLHEQGDDANDDTFGGGDIGTDFQFAQQTSQYAQKQDNRNYQPVSSSYHASTGQKSKLKPTVPASDLFASTEADFFGAPKKSTRSRTKEPRMAASNSFQPTLSSAASSTLSAIQQQATHPMPAYKTLEEIEAEARAMAQGSSGPATPTYPQQVQQPIAGLPGRHLTLEEIEREMMGNIAKSGSPAPVLPGQAGWSNQAPPHAAHQEQQAYRGTTPVPGQQGVPIPMMVPPPSRPAPQLAPQQQQPQQPPQQPDMTGIELLQKQLGSLTMFPPLGTPAPKPGQHAKSEEQMDRELDSRIRETEMAEMKRSRKANKIAGMARFNDLMTGGDKEFITRIQLSQLVTQDPYTSDFYAQVHSAITRARLAAVGAAPNNGTDGPTVLPVGPDGRGLGVGVVRGQGGPKRLKETAMQRMTVQVKRIVENAQKRAVAAPSASLQGALGKNKFRSSATAPRPALQVSASSRNLQNSTASTIANLLKGPGHSSVDRKQPLTSKQILVRLEQLYELILDLEQMRRDQPPPAPTEEQKVHYGMSDEEAEEKRLAAEDWSKGYMTAVETMWQALLVQEPLEISDPHPFISLLDIQKGHKLFGRMIRHLSHEQCLTVLILLVACFPQLDVIRNAPAPNLSSATMLSGQALRMNKDAEARTETFLSSVVPVVVQLVGRLELKMVAGMVSLCAERWDVSRVLATRPGVALFTILFSRAEMLKHVAAMPVPEGQIAPMVPSQVELDQWNLASTNLLRNLIPKLPTVFPSTQAQANAFGPGIYMLGGIAGNPASEIGAKDEKEGMKMDLKDGEVWGLIASFGLQAPPDEQTALVSCLRDKILHTVHSAKKGWVSVPRGELRLRNVNLFLNGLGLSADMIE